MAKRTRFTPTKSPNGWKINVPAKFSASGQRERHFFPSREKAEAAARTFRETRDSFGTQSIGISPTLAEMAVAASAILDPYGITLVEAARFAASHHERAAASESIENAVAEFQKKKEHRSKVQVNAYAYMSKDLAAAFPGRALSSIEGPELAEHIEKVTGGPGSFNQRRRLVAAFWRWAAKPPREWCDTKPIQHVETKEVIPAPIGTLTSDECRKLMQTAEEHFPDTVPAFAIMLFTGLRRQEVERLDPGDITEEGITISSAKAKTKRRRFIQMPAPLAEWLKVYPIGDEVCPANWRRKEKAVRRLAGWRVWCELAEPPRPPASLPAWPHNALRHTAATMALALGKPLEALVFEHGHSGGLNTLKNHYIGVMNKREAIAISQIGPNGSILKNIKAA